MSTEQASFIISLFAIFLSSLSFWISWRVMSRDRSDIKITVEYSSKTMFGKCIKVVVVNNGRRPTTIESVYLNTKSGYRYSYIVDHSGQIYLPKLLNETELAEFYFPIKLLRPRVSNPKEFTHVEVIDTRGNKKKISLTKYHYQDEPSIQSNH
jgi:hypothetical protein